VAPRRLHAQKERENPANLVAQRVEKLPHNYEHHVKEM
jgi:hypothetical protein